MRDISFRGKRVDNGKWAYGFYCHYNDTEDNGKDDCDYIVEKHNGEYFPCVKVIPATVGQYTGLTDKNGKKIFEGDIVRTKYGRPCKVIWFASPRENGWDLQPLPDRVSLSHKAPSAHDLYAPKNLEVIGNVYDYAEYHIYMG